MRKTRMQKGITLIALIITIIILLILAVVTIGNIKNSDIITYAQNASTDYSAKKDEEESIIAGYESLIETNLPVESKVTYTDEQVPIPAGFKHIEETKKGTGLVIENETEGSQFVWVPVENINTMVMCKNKTENDQCNIVLNQEKTALLCKNHDNSTDICGKLYGFVTFGSNFNSERTDQTYTSFTSKEPCNLSTETNTTYQAEFNEMAISVAKYGGFYVGRYEVSFNETRKAQSKGSAVEPYVYSATTTADGANTWYGLYELCKTYNTSSVKSSMIWGSQYDAMMIWMGSEAANFNTDNRNNDPERRTGYKSTDVIRNVYDLSGNSYEFTLEAGYGDTRVYRSTYYYGSNSITYRHNAGLPSDNCGSRLALYIV